MLLGTDGFASPHEGVPEGSELEADLELITIRKARPLATQLMRDIAVSIRPFSIQFSPQIAVLPVQCCDVTRSVKVAF